MTLEKLTYEVTPFEKGGAILFNRPPKTKVLSDLKAKGFKWDFKAKHWYNAEIDEKATEKLVANILKRYYSAEYLGLQAEQKKEAIETKEGKKESVKMVKSTVNKFQLVTDKNRVSIVKKLQSMKCDKAYTKSIMVQKDLQYIALDNGCALVRLSDDKLTDTTLAYDNNSRFIEPLEKVIKKSENLVSDKDSDNEAFYEVSKITSECYKKYAECQFMKIENNGIEYFYNPDLIYKALRLGFNHCKSVNVIQDNNMLKITSKENNNIAIVIRVNEVSKEVQIIAPTFKI